MPSANTLTAVREAGANLASSQYLAVKLNSSSQFIACSAATDIPFGILQNAPASGQAAEVAFAGPCKAKAGGNITAGAFIKAAADAEVVAATNRLTVNTADTASASDAVLGGHFMGIAMEGASDGQIIEVTLIPFGGIATTVS